MSKNNETPIFESVELTPAPKEIKPGFRTTEFWATLAANLIALFVLFGIIPVENKAQAQEVALQIIAAANGAYAIGRSLVKR